jgi:tetratricopeptide (TPR) repeat protein
MKVQALKEKARGHEQKEEWLKALELYREALRKQRNDPDITLYNRVGDIQTRLGQVDAAVESYEEAIDLYLESELPNNAIAICKKVLRNLPDRRVFFLRMGQIRGAQGFLTDARQNFLTFAEMATADGDMDGALDALVELVALAPDDLELRMGLASQLESHDRVEEAAEQYLEARERLILQEREEEAKELAEKVQELSPGITLPDAEAIRSGSGAQPELAMDALGSLPGLGLGSTFPEDAEGGEMEAELGEIQVPGGEVEEGEEEFVLGSLPGLEGEDVDLVGAEIGGMEGDEEVGDPLSTLDSQFEEGEEEEAEALPTFGLESGELEAEKEVPELPTFPMEEEEAAALSPMDFGEPDQGDRGTKEYVEEEEPLPALDVSLSEIDEGAGAGIEEVPSELAREAALEEAAAEARADAPGVAPPSSHEEAAERGDLDRAMEILGDEIAAAPDDVDLHQRMVEYAFQKADHSVLIPAYMGLAGALARTGARVKARAIYQQVLSLAPGHEGAQEGIEALETEGIRKAPSQVASSEEYVDLGAMILGEEAEKTTRWQVAADAPSGDDQADFAKMLSQFKKKVSEHVDADDVSAHHDLGTAYMEMGLLDEAISEFQLALRASPEHLPTHEVMGRCWMEAGKPDMAARALRRALEAPYEVEDELLGIYYLMGKALEELGNPAEAVEFYDKVFSLDINFEDVTERLRNLREG